MINQDLPQQFKSARLRSDIGLKQMAEILGRGITTIMRIEKGVSISERTREKALDWINRTKVN